MAITEINETNRDDGRRCPRHGLAIGPSGKCVLCAKESSPKGKTPGAKKDTSRQLVDTLLILLLVTSLFLLWKTSVDNKEEEALMDNQRTLVSQKRHPKTTGDKQYDKSGALETKEPDNGTLGDAAVALDGDAGIVASNSKKERKKLTLSEARRLVDIRMYVAKWCHDCKIARAYMQKHNISYLEFNIDKSASALAERNRINPKETVPTFKIDDTVLSGFNPSVFENAIDESAGAHL